VNWLAAVVNALLTGAFGLVSVGVLANACVSWHHVSTREGAAGYFVILLALLGAVVGAVIGVVATYFIGPAGFAESAKALGVAIGVAACAVGVATALSYWLADIPPTVDGQELCVEVEFRLPVGEFATTGEWRIALGSLENGRQRNSTSQSIALDRARDDDGRCVLPASVFLFTQRGERLLHLQRDGEYLASFLASIPARPGRQFSAWSEWLPRRSADGTPWPETSTSYRFRVVPLPPPPDPLDPDAAQAQAFAALSPDAPLTAWLAFLHPDAPPERIDAVMTVVAERPSELAALIVGPYVEGREQALDAVPRLPVVTPEVHEAVAAEGRAIAAALREFNALEPTDPRFEELQGELPGRFNHFKRAWWTTTHKLGHDASPPLQEILELAQTRARGTSMSEIVVNARVILDALPPSAESR